MDSQQRAYNERSDRQWSMAVYQKAKEVIIEVLKTQNQGVSFADITEAMRRKYPDLCDDTIGDPTNPKSPYWRHLVASAIQAFKKAGQVKKTVDGWMWIEERQPPPVVPPVPVGVREQLKDRLLKLDPKEFENVLAKVLKVLGIEEIKVTGRTADGGVDVEGAMPFLNLRVAVQAKRYTPQSTVGIDPVQRLIGSVISGGYTRGIFITTSNFTAGARETAERPDSRIVLVDGEKLVDIMMERGLGIKQVPVLKEELDEEFFQSITP